MSRPVMRIMIVDDHELIRRGVRNLIETKPCFEVVGEAGDGFEAVEVAARTRPDIAIVDYSLPQRNGLALSEILKKMHPKIEILLFTLCDREELVADLLHAGVRGFVLKSEAEHHLLDALDSLAVRRPYLSSAVSETLIRQALDNKPSSHGSSLTAREREIIQLIAEGRINKQIAYSLDISIKTVESHRASAMRKLSLGTTADLVRYAIRNQIVQA